MLSSWALKLLTMVTVAMKLKDAAPWKKSYDKPRHCIKKQKYHFADKAMVNLYSIFKGRDITLPTKIHAVKTLIFPIVMYRIESWTIKKVECQRTNAFKLWC